MARLYDFEDQLFSYLENFKTQIQAKPLNLGGVSGSGGGSGGPPGGFVGYLPQTRVAFDTSELEVDTIPASGASLLDNLNRIRYRLSVLESSGGGGGAQSFLQLNDTPSSYTGYGSYLVRVKPTQDGLEFVPAASGGGGGGASSFIDLMDTPSSYTTYSGCFLLVNPTETGIEFKNPNEIFDPITQSYQFFVDGILASVADIQMVVVEKDIVLKEFYVALADTGTSSTTTVVLRKNGSNISGASVAIPYNSANKYASVTINETATKGDILSISIINAAIDANTLSAIAIFEADTGIVGGGGGGASAFTDLTDTPSSYSGQGLKVLRVNSSETGIEFATISGGSGGSNGVSIYFSDSPPTSASSFNDEFNDNNLSGWNIFNHTGNSENITFTENALGLIMSLDTSLTRAIMGISKSLSGVSYPITFYTKVSLNTLRDLNMKAGIAIYENPSNSSGRIVFVHLNSVGFESYQAIDRFYNYNDGSYTNWIQESIGRITNGVYLKVTIRQSGPSTFYFNSGISLDGLGWIDFSSANSLGFTPQGIGLAVWKSASDTGLNAIFRFFRADNNSFLSSRLPGRLLQL